MRRDLFHTFDHDVKTVFEAYEQVIKTYFKRSPRPIAYELITYDIGYCFKYNINGGQINIHFSVDRGKTFVQVRYTIIQLIWARYETYDKALTMEVMKVLKNKPIIPNEVKSGMVESTQAPTAHSRFCFNCGTPLEASANFCPNCGQKINK